MDDLQPDLPDNKKDPHGDEPTVLDDSPKPIAGKWDSMKQQSVVDELMGLYGKWNSWRKPYETMWDEMYRLYLSSIAFTSKTPTRSKVFVPVTFQVVETALAKFVSLIFNQEEFFETVPDDPKDEAQAEIITKLLLHQLTRNSFFLKFMDYCKQKLMYGTTYMYIYWLVKRNWVWSRIPKMQDVTFLGFKLGQRVVGWEEKKEYKVVERRPQMDVIDILDVYPDPRAKDEQDGKGVFIRSFISKDDFKQLCKGKYPVYANGDDPRLDEETKELIPARVNRYGIRGVSDPVVWSKGMVELLSFWGRYDVDGDGIKEEALIVMANRSVLARAIANPFHHQKRPLVRDVLVPVPMEWYGVGLIEPIIPLQHELNTLRRQRLDNINQSLNNMWKVNTLADVDVDTLKTVPNGIVLTDDMTAVERMDTTDSTGRAYEEAQIVQSDIENVTVPRSVQGIPDNGKLGRTARGAQMIIGQALEKFGVAAKLTEEAIKKMLRMMHQLNLQFLDSEDVAKETGMTGSTMFDGAVTPDMIRAEVKFHMIGISDMIGKEGKINQITSFVGMFQNALTPNTVIKLAQRVWKMMGFDPDDIEAPNPIANVMSQMKGAAGPEANQAAQAVAGQAQNNGTEAPVAVPGVPSQPAQ
jgi:hypothetical protein